MMIAVPQARGFGFHLAAGWWTLPTDPATRETEIAAFVAERRTDATPELQREIVRILSETAAAANAIDAGLCAEYAATDEEGRLRTASLLVTEAADDLSGADLEELAAGMAREGFSGVMDPQLTECSAVTLPRAGRAIRVRFDPRFTGSDSPGIGTDSLRLQFFVPMPGTGSTAVITFSSPVRRGQASNDALVQLFDDVAETFSFLDERGEPIGPAA